MLEDVELHSRIRLGTSYGRTQLSRDHLKLVLENEDVIRGTKRKVRKTKGQKAKEKKDVNSKVEC